MNVNKIATSLQFKDMKHLLNAICRVTLWHDPLIGEKLFLGQVNLSIGSITTPHWSQDGWYWLCPRPATPTQANRPDFGALRVKLQYSQDVIYPLKVYDPLSQMLLESTVASYPGSLQGQEPGNETKSAAASVSYQLH